MFMYIIVFMLSALEGIYPRALNKLRFSLSLSLSLLRFLSFCLSKYTIEFFYVFSHKIIEHRRDGTNIFYDF